MRLRVTSLLLLLVPDAWAQSVTTRVLAGQNYCHEVQLTSTWTVDAKGDRQIIESFRNGEGKLAFRAAGPDSVLVSYFVESYGSRASPSRIYSSRKLLLPLKNADAAQAATEPQWTAAAVLRSYRDPAFLPTAVSKEEGAEFRGFEFAKTGQYRIDHPFAISPGGDWMAQLSWSGEPSRGGLIFAGRPARGSMYVDVDRVASSERPIRVQLDFSGFEPDQLLSHAVWISDRHLVFPVNRLHTRVMVCDLSPFHSGSQPVFDTAGAAEILGFSEETTIHDVSGYIGGFVLHVGVRVPEDGKYRLGGTIANEKGQSTSRTQEYDLTAGVNWVPFGLDPPRQMDGKVKVSNLRLDKMVAKVATPLARRDSAGTFGPYVLALREWGARRKALDYQNHGNGAIPVPGETPVLKSSPIKTRTLPGKVENVSAAPNAAGKLTALRMKVAVPRVAGECVWYASIEAGGKMLAGATTKINSATPPESIVFEFNGGVLAAGKPADELRLAGVGLLCREAKMTGWSHNFDQFPKYLIPGVHPAMFQAEQADVVTFTGKNRVELIDSNRDGKYEAIKATVGFKAARPCGIWAHLKDGDGNGGQVHASPYVPPGAEVTFLIGFFSEYSAGAHVLDDFMVTCTGKDGLIRPASYDKKYRVSLGTFSSENFQPAFELSFANPEPILENGFFVYKVNCTPHWTLDLPVEFSRSDLPATDISFDPPRGACKPNATTLRFKPRPEAPGFQYNVTVDAHTTTGDFGAMTNTTWVKASTPEVLGVRPNTGAGKRVSFQVAGDDLSTGVGKIELLINDKEDIRRACHITIMGLATTLSDDAGGSVVKETKNPTWLSIENSQCTIEKGYIGGMISPVPLRFKPGFDGPKSIYVRAWNGGGATTGWTKQGSWTVSQNEISVPLTVSPYFGASAQQTFAFTFADVNGAADLAKVEALIAFASGDDHGCRLSVDRTTGRATLMDGAAVKGSIPLGSAETVASAQCSVGNVQVIEERGRMLRVAADIRFTPAFKGRRNVFLKSADKATLESGWVWAGSWSAP